MSLSHPFQSTPFVLRPGDYLKWLWYGEATLHAPITEIMMQKVGLPAEKQVLGILPLCEERLRQRLGPLEKAIEGKDYLIGGRFTAADIMIAYSLHMVFNVRAARCLLLGQEAVGSLGRGFWGLQR